jgi:hypothetical protein
MRGPPVREPGAAPEDVTGELIIEPAAPPTPIEEIESRPPPATELVPPPTERPSRWNTARERAAITLTATVWGVSLIAITTLPAVVARLATATVTEGGFFLARDNPQFLSAIHQGRVEGAWLFTDHFSPEPHAAAFVYPLYLALGHISAAMNISEVDAYDGVCFIARVFLWLSFAVVAGRLLNIREQSWAYALSVMSGGLVAALLAIQIGGLWEPGAWSYLPPSANLVYMLLAPPHWMLGVAVALWITLAICDQRLPRRARLAILGMGTLIEGLVFPFLLPVIVSAVLASLIFEIRSRSQLKARLSEAILVGTVASPFVIYNGLLFTFDPFWAAVYGPSQNYMASPPPWFLPAFLGIAVIPGVWGMLNGWRSHRRELQVLAVITCCTLAWMYIPVSFQRRAGVELPLLLGLLGAPVVVAWPIFRRRAWRATFIGLGLAETAVVVLLTILAAAGVGPWPSNSLPRNDFELVEWLAPRVGPADVVLAPKTFSAFLASRISGRISSSDAGTTTLDWPQKQRWVEEYFSPTTSVEDRRFLERRLGDPNWLVAPRTFVANDPNWIQAAARENLVVYFRSR